MSHQFNPLTDEDRRNLKEKQAVDAAEKCINVTKFHSEFLLQLGLYGLNGKLLSRQECEVLRRKLDEVLNASI